VKFVYHFTLPEMCPGFSAANDPWIAIRVAWRSKHRSPVGIYRRLSSPSGIVLAVDLTASLAYVG
jgi:hypothetical protein